MLLYVPGVKHPPTILMMLQLGIEVGHEAFGENFVLVHNLHPGMDPFSGSQRIEHERKLSSVWHLEIPEGWELPQLGILPNTTYIGSDASSAFLGLSLRREPPFAHMILYANDLTVSEMKKKLGVTLPIGIYSVATDLAKIAHNKEELIDALRNLKDIDIELPA